MGKIDAGFPGYELTQSGSQVQNILNAVSALSGDAVQELLQLLKEIQDYGGDWDDEENIAVQLKNILDSAVMENEVQKSVNDNNTYPPTSKAVKDAIETHANKSELEHPNKSVKQRHIDDGAIGTNQLSDNAVTSNKIANYAISHNKLSSALNAEISNAINPTELFVHISQISRAPKYALSDLCIEPLEERYCIPNISSFYIVLKNDTGTVFSNEKSENGNYKYDNQQESIFDTTNGSCDIDGTLQIGKTYLCSYHKQEFDNPDTVTRNISVVCEVGSELIDLITASKGWNGTWKYGNELDYTGLGQIRNIDIDNVKQGDFYLNQDTYGVYMAINNTGDWKYLGNLSGSIDIDALFKSPTFTGVPIAPTPAVSNNSNQLATTEYVRDAIDKYAGGDSGGGVSTDLIDNVENLVRDVYGTKQVADTVSIKISSNFNLSFTCSSYNVGSPSSGTWSCTDISSLYNNILIDNQPLKHHPSVMDITSIEVSDSYLENNYHEIIIGINLNPNEPDSFPVGALSNYHTNMIFSVPTENAYPRIYSTNNNEIQIALGYITLPDTGVTVNGSEQILNVKAIDFGDITIGTVETANDLNSLTTTYKTDLIGAINELAGKIGALRQELVDNKYLT